MSKQYWKLVHNIIFSLKSENHEAILTVLVDDPSYAFMVSYKGDKVYRVGNLEGQQSLGTEFYHKSYCLEHVKSIAAQHLYEIEGRYIQQNLEKAS